MTDNRENRDKTNPQRGNVDPNRGESGGMGGRGGQGEQSGQSGKQGAGQTGQTGEGRQGGLGGQGTQGGKQQTPGEVRIGDPNREQAGRKAKNTQGDEEVDEDDATGFDRGSSTQRRRSEEDNF